MYRLFCRITIGRKEIFLNGAIVLKRRGNFFIAYNSWKRIFNSYIFSACVHNRIIFFFFFNYIICRLFI